MAEMFITAALRCLLFLGYMLSRLFLGFVFHKG